MKNRNKPSFRIAQSVDVVRPSKENAFLISVSDWNFLKEKISRLTTPPTLYNSIGAGLLGVSASALVASLTFQEGTSPATHIISWAVFSVSLICGILCLYFHHCNTKDFSVVHKQSILDELTRIEKKFLQ
jgi:hypothetical protein